MPINNCSFVYNPVNTRPLGYHSQVIPGPVPSLGRKAGMADMCTCSFQGDWPFVVDQSEKSNVVSDVFPSLWEDHSWLPDN